VVVPELFPDQGAAGVRHGFRTRVWRELPFSARRAILSTLRTVDQIDEWLAEAWKSFQESPAWLLVATAGMFGLVLTVLLLFAPPQPAPAKSVRTVPPREHSLARTPPRKNPGELDSRIEIAERPATPRSYPAEFLFVEGDHDRSRRSTTPALRQPQPAELSGAALPGEVPPPSSTKPRTDDVVPWDEPPLVRRRSAPSNVLVDEETPARESARPDVQPLVTFWRHATATASPSDITLLRVQAVPPEVLSRAQDPLAGRADGWTVAAARASPAVELPVRYAGEPVDDSDTVVGAGASLEDPWDVVQDWPTQTEVAVRLELRAPEAVRLAHPQRSELVIRNLGSETVRRVQVREQLTGLDVVTQAFPGGVVRGDVLERELRRLRPRRERTLELDWWPTSAAARYHAAQVLIEAAVAASVDVRAAVTEPADQPHSSRDAAPSGESRERLPAVEAAPEPGPGESELPAAEPEVRVRPRPEVQVSVRGTRTVRRSEVAEVVIEVRNTGNVPLHDVRIWADVPPALVHRHGPQLEYEAGSLAPGESHVTVLRVLAGQAGLAVAGLRVISAEQAEAETEVRLTVLDQNAAAPPGSPSGMASSTGRASSRDTPSSTGAVSATDASAARKPSSMGTDRRPAVAVRKAHGVLGSQVVLGGPAF